MRIQKVLADAGVASRRGAEALIAAGRVTVDGEPATIGQRVDPARVRLSVDGRPVGPASETVHLLLAKPAGVTSTVRDRHAARTVIELVPARLRQGARLYPVGRLDRDSEGLIVLTNDGPWAERVLHPRHGVEREYAVGLAQQLDGEQRRALAAGIEMEEGRATLSGLRRLRAAELDELDAALGGGVRGLRWYSITLRQGWKRQVRRMFAGVGVRVERLVRVRLGGLRLAGMQLGELRRLTAAEASVLAGGTSADAEARGASAAAATGDDHAPAASSDERAPGTARRLVVAIDGPGGSGKSTVGAQAARRLGYRFCDTGVLYRGLTWLAVEHRADFDDPAALLPLVALMELAPDAEDRYVRLMAEDSDVTDQLHTAAVDRHVSRVSQHAALRGALLPIQRRLAAGGGMIMAGRDIGTIVLPDADLKIYLDVSIAERTRRRALERGVAADPAALEAIERELRRRDGIDSSRATAPLRIPDDALVIATEHNTFDQTVDHVVDAIERAAAGD